MAYNLKYRASYQAKTGEQVVVQIWQKDYSGYVYDIATLQSLVLEVGGGNDPIYAPVVKTTVRLQLADAFDIGTTVGGVPAVTTDASGYYKHGQWEEFYTNDATKYLVKLITNIGGRAGVFWQGYVTPDSWEESMIYRGNITIVARDMLGSLSDYDFDAPGVDGLISVGDLINAAVAKCSAAMPVTLDSARSLRNISEDTSIYAAMISVKAFAGKDWWSALTSTLEALGLVMRYNGNGGWVVCSLRYLPSLSLEQNSCEFINTSGLRTLDPPVKEIAADYQLDLVDGEIDAPAADDVISDSGISAYAYLWERSALGEISGARYTQTVPKAKLRRSSGGWITSQTTRPSILHKIALPADDSLFENGWKEFSKMYFVANAGGDYGDTYFEAVGDVTMSQGLSKAPCRLLIYQDGAILTSDGARMYLPTPPPSDSKFEAPHLTGVKVYVRCASYNGTLYHYNGDGGWILGEEKTNELYSDGLEPLNVTPGGDGTLSLDISAPVGLRLNPATFQVCVVGVYTSGYMSIDAPHNGLFVPLGFAFAEPADSGIATEYSVKTIYNENYNVRISRSPSIISVDTVLPGIIMQNVLKLTNGTVLDNSWNWAGETKGYPLEVMIQAQLLQLYSDALSVFTGSVHDRDFPKAVPGSSYQYFSRNCVLLRGIFDFGTGFINNVALREYRTWEQVWGSFEPQYTEEGTRGSGGGSSGGSGSPGGGGGGGTTVVWGDETAAHYAPLSVGSDQRTVALEGHVHTIPQITGLQDALDAINGKIPSQASASNQLADKDFVNSSIATNTATYISNNGQPFTSVAQLQAYTGPHDNNDYAFVVGKDADGNTTYTRYKYNGKTSIWGAEYVLNNSSFTAAQWAAINSGITEALRQKLEALPTAEALNDTLDHLENDKQDVLTFDDAPTSGSSNPVKSGGIFDRFVSIVNLIGQKATAAWGAVTNYVAKLTINGTEKEVLLKGWNPGVAGNTGLPTYAHPGGEESYKYTKGSSGTEQTITEELNAGQPRKIDHIGTHPELSAPVAIPCFINDLAYFRQRGGGCKLYVNNVERSDLEYAYNKDALFNCGPGSLIFDGSNTYQPEGGIAATYYRGLTSSSAAVRFALDFTTLLDAAVQLDGTYFTTKFAYGSYLYIDFGNDWWGPRECTAIVKYGRFTRNAQGGVASIIEDTANRQTFKYTGPGDEGHLDFLRMIINSGTSYGIIGVDVVMTGFHKDSGEQTIYKYKPRVSEIGVVGNSSRGPAEGLMARGADDPVYRSITPAKADTYDLGASARRWRYAFVKRVYLSDTAYLEIGQDGKAHLYGATGLVVENGDIASAG